VGGMVCGRQATLDQRIINNAVAQGRQRLRVCVQAVGEHFEHLL